MKFTCDKESLLSACIASGKGAAAKSTNPALEGLLISAGENEIKITGYDLSLGIESTFSAQVIEKGAIIAEARIFTDIVRSIPGDTLTVSAGEDNAINVISGLAEYNIVGIPSVEFPELFKVEPKLTFRLPQQILKSMLRQTAFAIAATGVKTVNSGALFDIHDDVLKVVTINESRMALRKENIPATGTDYSFIVPGKTVGDILKLLDDEEKDIEINVSAKHLLIQIENVVLVSRLLEGKFTDYNAVIPSKAEVTTTVFTRDFLDSIERVSLMLNDKLKKPIRCTFDYDAIRLTSKTPMGNAYDELAAVVDGNVLEIGFNDRFMAEALRAAECDKVTISMTTPLSPIVIRPEHGDSFVMLVLPVRLKAE